MVITALRCARIRQSYGRARLSVFALLAAWIVTLAACNDSPTEPLPRPFVDPPRVSPPVDRLGDFPPVAGTAVIYDRVSYSFIVGSSSRYVFRDDTTFALQYVTPAFGFFEYKGQYSRTDSLFTFAFEGWSVMGPWLAQGTLRGNTLIVRYNDVMLWTDFEDGEYVRAPTSAR